MKLKIINKTKNPLFHREEIEAEIENDVTPSRLEVSKLITEEIKVSGDTVLIKTILGNFGSKNFNVTVFIYDSKEELERMEGKQPVVEIEEKPEEVKSEEVKPEEIKEKPVEEVSEENKSEEVSK